MTPLDWIIVLIFISIFSIASGAFIFALTLRESVTRKIKQLDKVEDFDERER